MLSIAQALAALDPSDDDHWTGDGLPKVELVAHLAGSGVTRARITDAAPDFNRERSQELREKAESVPRETPPPPPPVDVDPAAYVEPEDDVVGLDVKDVYADVDLVERAIKEFNRQNTILDSKKTAIEAKIREIGVRTARLEKVKSHYMRKGVQPEGYDNLTQIQRYQQGQKDARAKRAANAKKFIDAQTTPGEVAAQLRTASPIDQAYAARKPAPGSRRPTVPLKHG